MNNDLLLIGTGGAGNKLLNTFLTIDDSYDAIFVNSNANEVKILDKCRNDMRLIISGGGTGRNRATAVEHLKESISKVGEFLYEKSELYNHFLIMASMDGGFGSGSVPMIAKAIKNMKPDSKIGVTLVFPSLKSKKLSIENTLDCYNDILSLKKEGVIDSIMFIDNNKMKDEDEFNTMAMEALHQSLNITYGSIDATDTSITNFATGYKTVLLLDEDADCAEEALDEARKSSLFLTSKSWKCTHMLASVSEDSFEKDDFEELIDVSEFVKTEYSDDMNIIVMTGCKIPSKPFSELQGRLEDIIKASEEEDDVDDEFMIKRAWNKAKKETAIDKTTSVKTSSPEKKMSKKELRKKLGKLWD